MTYNKRYPQCIWLFYIILLVTQLIMQKSTFHIIFPNFEMLPTKKIYLDNCSSNCLQEKLSKNKHLLTHTNKLQHRLGLTYFTNICGSASVVHQQTIQEVLILKSLKIIQITKFIQSGSFQKSSRTATKKSLIIKTVC